MDKWLGGVRKNLDAIGFGSAVPGLRDRIFDVIAPKDEPAKATPMEDEKEKRRKMMGRRGGMGQRGMMGSRPGMKKGGKVKSASKRGDGCARQGKTKGRMV